MANTNNLMSISVNPAAGSSGTTGKLGYKSSSNGGNDFNSALDRANNTINRQAAPAQQNPTDAEEVSYSDAATKNPEAPVEQQNANTNTANQGNTNQPQDAPQNVTQNQAATANVPAEVDTKNILADTKIEPENILPEVEIKPEVEIADAPEVQNILPFFFNANTETLLPSQVTENAGEVNLMAVVPQSNESKGQEMLNILSGKTWTTEDVKATLTAQNLQSAQVVEVNPETLNLAQNDKNFTFNPKTAENVQPQIFTRQNTLTPEQPQIQNQIQAQNQPVILNSEQSPQIQTVNLNTQETLQPTAQRQIEMQNQPILNSVNPQVEPNQNNQLNRLTDLFGGNLQVENENAPLSPVQPTLNQQPEQNQQQAPNQNNLPLTSQDTTAEVQTQNVGGTENFVPNVTPANNNVSTAQPVTQTPDAAATAQAARDAENVPAQIVEHARLIRTAENTEMVINLKPEHLGQLTLRVSVSQNGAVNASFYSDNAQVRAAIENSIVQLKQELSDQGLKVDNVQVSSYLSDSGLMNGQGGQAWQQQQQNHSRPIDFETLQEEVDAVTPETETNSTDGVDYKI